MRYKHLKAHGFRPYLHDLDIDLDAVSGKVIAIHGPNGAGKSTFVELLPAGPYREFQTHGSLASMATTRDAFFEVVVENGRRYTIRHEVDAQTKKGSSLVLDDAGQPVLRDGKVATFDAWSLKTFIDQDVYFAGPFCPQLSMGMLGLTSGERMGVVLRAIGVERYETLAKDARERAAASLVKYTAALARLEDERGRSVAEDVAVEALAVAETAAASAEADVATSRASLAALELERAAFVAAQEHRRALSIRRAELHQRVDVARGKHDGLLARLQSNRAVLERVDAVRAASDRIKAIDVVISGLDAEIRSLQERKAAADDAARRERAAIGAAMRRRDAANARAKAAGGAEALLGEVVAAEARIPGLTAEHGALCASLADAVAEVERMQGQRVAGAEQRIIDLRTGLELVQDGCPEPAKVAGSALSLDDGRIQLAAELPSRLQAASAAVRDADSALTAARVACDACRATAARRPEAERLLADGAAAEREAAEAFAEWQTAESAAKDSDVKAMETASDLATAGESRRALQLERLDLSESAGMLDHLKAAEATIAALKPQADAASAELLDLQAELDNTPDQGGLLAEPDFAGARLAADRCEARARDAAARVAVAQRELEGAKASAAHMAAIDADRAAVEEELADWTRLASDLGREGIQASEVDAAFPELTELTNDLLHNTVGPRWTVTWSTTRGDAKGKKQIEEVMINVLDTVAGRDADGREYSPGERALLDVAISLALTMYACRTLGITRPTIVRDESSSGLSPENSVAYVQMLRRVAASSVAPDKILFISHNPAMWELADAQIVVAGGTAGVFQ